MGEVTTETHNNAERFLPRIMLRVLLVEADHSTRHIIAALLRKCGHKVAAVCDGLKAWETIKTNASDIDLVLTELDLPSISGFSLLTLIMDHHTCKHIPVIMMSSQDSVTMVYKCMLKGALDFLIKPVRSNELRNLWQHVWRRQTISRPPQNLTFPQNKLDVAEQNYAATSNYSAYVASAQKNNECNEKTSEAQSTCTSPFLEAESPYMENMQETHQLMSSSSLSNNDTLKHGKSNKSERESAKHNDEAGEKSTILISEAAKCNKTSTRLRLGQGYDHSETENKDEVIRTELSKVSPYIKTKIPRCNDEQADPSTTDLIATFENLPKSTDENCSFNAKIDFDTQLELSLRRDFPGSPHTPTIDERQILNHSNASAFSRYSSSKLLHPLFPTNNPYESRKSYENQNASHQCGGENQNEEHIKDMMIGQSGQAEAKLSNCQLGFFPATSDESTGNGNVFLSMFYGQSVEHPTWTPKSVCQKESSPFPTSTSSLSNPKSPKSEHHHLSDDAIYSFDQIVNYECAVLDSPATGLSSGTSFYHDAENHNTGGVCGGGISSGSDGNATSAVVGKNNLGCSMDNDHFDRLRGTNFHVTSQREAALTKFRLKRKDRCYEKKVRYESRKRLAEQRPRVKGQFVRQAQSELD